MPLPDLDPRFGNNFIDANVLDGANSLEDRSVNEILRLHDEGAFTLQLPHSVRSEIKHPNTPAAVKRLASSMVYTIPTQLTAGERLRLTQITALIQGNAEPGQHARDALHLFESAKYGGRHFITNDGRLLNKAEAIWKLLGIKVLTPEEFLQIYRLRSESDRLHT